MQSWLPTLLIGSTVGRYLLSLGGDREAQATVLVAKHIAHDQKMAQACHGTSPVANP